MQNPSNIDTSNMTPDPSRAGHWIDADGEVVSVGTANDLVPSFEEAIVALREVQQVSAVDQGKVEDLIMQNADLKAKVAAMETDAADRELRHELMAQNLKVLVDQARASGVSFPAGEQVTKAAVVDAIMAANAPTESAEPVSE